MKHPSTQNLQNLDNSFLHPWEDIQKVDKNQRTVITEADGVYIEDSDGNRLLDAPAGMWCVNIGHRRKEMADAIAEQCMQLSYVSPWSLTNAPASQLAKKLAELSPGDLNHVFFTTGGSTAVDSALRFVQFKNNVLGQPEKKHFICRQDGYHGSTFLAASASGKTRDKNHLDFDTEHFHRLSSPHRLKCPDGMSQAEYCQQKVDELENKILELGPTNVAGFIAEPIQASGGVILAPEGYHRACLEVCRKHDVVYISDEVVTAFGRLGHFFASEEVFDIVPDIITTAKGISSGYVPLGAFLVSDRLLKQIQAVSPDAVFSNGFTYSGHPVACAAALKNIEIMENENLLQHAREITPYFQQSLQNLRSIPIVSDVRGIGLMACVECDITPEGQDSLNMDYDIGNRIDKHCQNLGLLVRPIVNMCVMSPPLIINKEQIDELVEKLGRGIELAMQEVIDEGIWKPN